MLEKATVLTTLFTIVDDTKAVEKLEALLVEHHLARYMDQSIASGDEEALLAAFVQFYQLMGSHQRRLIIRLPRS